MASGAISRVFRLAFVSALRQRTANRSHQKGRGVQPPRYRSPNRSHVQAFSEQRLAIAGRFAGRSLIQIKKPAPAMRLMALMNAKIQPRLEPGSPPHLAEVIEAADRKIKDYLLRQHLSLWHPISTAPNNQEQKRVSHSPVPEATVLTKMSGSGATHE